MGVGQLTARIDSPPTAFLLSESQVTRITIAILAGVALCAACCFAAPAGSGPALGKWEYMGKESAETSNQLEAPCTWAPATRTVSFSTGVNTTHTYTAVLSTDGKSLTGKWTEAKADGKKSIVRTGDWPAKLKP